MRVLVLALVAALSVSGRTPAQVVGDRQIAVRVTPTTQAQLDAEMTEINARALERQANWFNNYHRLDEIELFIDSLAVEHPDMVTIRTIGTSIEGRDIIAFDIAAPDTPASAPVVIFSAALHPRNWIGTATILYIADQMLDGYGHDIRITDILSNIRIVFVPVVNPDGYVMTWSGQREWRKNARQNADGTVGVDLNRNWSRYWGGPGSSGEPGDQLYRGTAPFSEPETRALRDLALGEPTLATHVCWLGFGQSLLHPLSGTTASLPFDDWYFFWTLGSDLSDTIFGVHASEYQFGHGWEIGISSGTNTDWFYLEAGVPSWTFLLRSEGATPGFILPPGEIIPTGEEMLPAALLLIERSAMPLTIEYTNGRPNQIDPDTPRRVDVRAVDNAQTFLPGSLAAYIRSPQGGTTLVESSPAGPNSIVFWLPPTTCGQILELIVQAKSTEDSDVRSTTDAHAIQIIEYLDDDAELDLGWQYADPADTGTDGHWERGDPEETLLQPENDTSPDGTFCFVTGALKEGYDLNNDVDGGTVSLISPRFDLSGMESADIQLTYQRWVYTWINDSSPDDWFRVSLSNDDGASWTVIDEPTRKKGGWNLIRHAIQDTIAPTAQVRVRFQAHDGAADSPVEMAVDDVELIAFACVGCGRADTTTQNAGVGEPGFGTPDGVITGADILYFVNAWIVADDTIADMTTQNAPLGNPSHGVPDGLVTGADLSFFVNLWIAGCP